MTYKIVARIDATDTHGYSVYDYFRGADYDGDILDREFATELEAASAARDAYKGADIDGVGCVWRIELRSELA